MNGITNQHATNEQIAERLEKNKNLSDVLDLFEEEEDEELDKLRAEINDQVAILPIDNIPLPKVASIKM